MKLYKVVILKQKKYYYFEDDNIDDDDEFEFNLLFWPRPFLDIIGLGPGTT